MSKSPKGTVILRILKTQTFLSEPHTVKELSEHLGIIVSCTYSYITMLKKAAYPLKSRVRVMPGTGLSPVEYWINYPDVIVREAIRLISELEGM